MLPILEVPESIRQGMEIFRPVFCREEGFEAVSRFTTGLIISPNKTLQGIYDLQIWGPAGGPSRRAMHAAVFEAGWDSNQLMKIHRAKVAQAQSRGGRQIIDLDWTLAHHERGPEIFANDRAWDYVDQRMARYQTVVTAVVSNRQRVDGLEVEVQVPQRQIKEEQDYLKHTAQKGYEQM